MVADRNILSWEDRLRIAVDAAQGQKLDDFHNPFVARICFLLLLFFDKFCVLILKLRTGVSALWL